MAKENNKDPAIPQHQQIPLAKIHDLPGVIITKQPDKSYGGLVTSIQAGGVKEPVVLRLREDGEYQLVTGYRRRRASELAKKQDVPALVYEMSLQEAQDYHHRVKKQPDMPIPGKLVQPLAKGQDADLKKLENPTAAPAAGGKGKEQEKPAEGVKAPAADMEQTTISMPTEKDPTLADGDKDKGHEVPAKSANVPTQTASGPAAKGPVGTTISQVLPERLSPPDEAAKKDFPAPKEGESIFVTLHPAYLKNSEYNIISVDTKSEDYQELKKSIELNGVKDPVLARIGDAGTLEIVSGQRRHMIATELNYPVPTIIQKISTPDVKNMVADGNLHRPKISTYDLAHSISFLKPENQDEVLHLMDLGAKIPVERIEYMKKVEKAGKLNEETMRDVIDGKNVLDPPKQEAPQAPQPEQPESSAPAASTIPPSPDVAPPAAPPSTEGQERQESHDPTIPAASSTPAPAAPTGEQPSDGQEPFDGKQERPEYTKVVLAGDRLRKYFPDVMMTPREIEESIYEALEERRQCQEKQKEKLTLFPKKGPAR